MPWMGECTASPATSGEDEVPLHVWEFGKWLRRYWLRRGRPGKFTSAQYAEVEAEAIRRGLTIEEDPRGLSIDYVKQ